MAYIYIDKLECNTDNKMGFTCHILLTNIRYCIFSDYYFKYRRN